MVMNNQYASYNMEFAISSMKDTDMIEEMSDLQKDSILEQIQIQMQKKRMEEEEQKRQVIQVN